MTPLLRRLDWLIASTTAPSSVDQDLRQFLELALEARAGRAENGERSAERSALARGRVRFLIGVKPLTRPTSELVGIVLDGAKARTWRIGKWQAEDEIRILRQEERAALGVSSNTSARAWSTRLTSSST